MKLKLKFVVIAEVVAKVVGEVVGAAIVIGPSVFILFGVVVNLESAEE